MILLFRRGRVRGFLLAGGLFVFLFLLDRLFPPPLPASEEGGRMQPQVVLARDGTPLRAFPGDKHIWRHPVRLEDVSPLYLDAVIAYEDRFFWKHPGVNPGSLLRAAWQWLRYGRVVSGGSTLTMQVARMLEPLPRTVYGKIRQILRALQIELRLPKREILRLYLIYAPMGGVLEGVEAASRAYLGKPSMTLSHAEAALLAVLPQSPSRLRPDRYPERSRAARDKVLDRMEGLWDKDTTDDARMETVVALTAREPLLAALFAERMRRLYPGRARIDTTIDAELQSRAEQIISARLSLLPPRVSIAALAVDNATLETRVYVGSADFGDDKRFSHIDMTRSKRSPGSTLKPFLYGLALDEGLIHSESLLADTPQSFSGYQPGNFQANFSGPVSVSEALRKSLNVPAVETLDRLEPRRFVSQLRRGGLKLELPRGAEPNLSIILGGAAVSLEGLVGAYSALARRGIAGKPRYTKEMPLEEHYMMSEGAAFIVRDVLESGGLLARQIEDSLGARRGIAWKTGTSFGFRDAWAVGVSDFHTVGVWTGRPDGTPNPGFFGANLAAPLLIDLFAAIEDGTPSPRVPPASVTQAKICWPLGARAASTPENLCHQERLAWLLNDAAPPTFPDRLRDAPARYTDHRDAVSGLRVRAACAPGKMRGVEMARWPVLLEPWLSAALRARALPPAWEKACAGTRAPDGGLRIVGLTHGETIVRAGNTSSAPKLRLETRGGQDEIVWIDNGKQIGRAPAGRGFFYAFAERGRHEITAMDIAGQYDRVIIDVQ
ncbi:MAG: penicillin-binding protein 1C [Candidatus Accumulibacter sp.]|jgi:penicillin-binding protein 1C|nr:penicillin-binding protein 1C [Accumulibacter sp.]